MDKSFEVKYFELEEKSWWCQARRDMIIRLIKSLRTDNNSRILEIGCSGGTLTKLLQQAGFKNVYGIDNSKTAIELCRRKRLKNVFVMDGEKTRFKNNEFDLVIASDILEHIKKDNSALKEWRRILKPNGTLLVFVPAFKFLWSEHDYHNRHYRRYTKKKLIEVLESADFNIERASYWNFTLFFPAGMVRAFQNIFLRKKAQSFSKLYEINPVINSAIVRLLKLENQFLRIINFPAGVSVFAIARK